MMLVAGFLRVCPSSSLPLTNLSVGWLLLRPLPKFDVTDLFWPSNVEDAPEEDVQKRVDLLLCCRGHVPGLCSVQQH